MSFPTWSWVLPQKEQRNVSIGPVRFKLHFLQNSAEVSRGSKFRPALISFRKRGGASPDRHQALLLTAFSLLALCEFCSAEFCFADSIENCPANSPSTEPGESGQAKLVFPIPVRDSNWWRCAISRLDRCLRQSLSLGLCLCRAVAC